MLKSHVHQSTFITTLFPFSKPFLNGNDHGFRQVQSSPSLKKGPNIRISSARSKSIKAKITTSTHIATSEEKLIKVKAIVTAVKPTFQIRHPVDGILDFFGERVCLEIVSAELNPNTRSEKSTIQAHAHKLDYDENGYMQYESEFNVPFDFGKVGAIYVENEHHTEMYLKHIVLEGCPTGGPVNITCNSWIQPKSDNKPKRIFFTNNKSYLPSETPAGLKRLRDEELQNLRGNGQGERETHERIYDYDVYNDLGDSDADPSKLKRPVLGGKQYPYPRRCRTGYPHCKNDPLQERRVDKIYVPRDEKFSDVKQETVDRKKSFGKMQSVLPTVENIIIGDLDRFEYFTEIDLLFDEEAVNYRHKESGYWEGVRRFLMGIKKTVEGTLHFKTPETMDRDKFFWFRDEEFARETLAGLNPCSIQLITEWPLKSQLNPEVYGPQVSAITAKIIEKGMGGMITVEEAIKQKKLFILDYHDLLLPYVEKVRKLESMTLYGSRTIFFLNPDDTLTPLAIELTRPPMDGKTHWRKVYTPSSNSTECWLWRLAKAHVLAHDSGYHQLVSHWLRTHCAVEPYIIATNRQLSMIHPIYRLLHPHFRYTMEMNASARQTLINAGGTIETTFSPGKYCMEFSSFAYDKLWRFDYEALPKDLIRRGMAAEDPSVPYGLKLTIEDYPFAKDGLDLWDVLKQWVTDYVNHFYKDSSRVESDEELQAWWTEIRTVGHGDKKDEPWWPVLKTPQDLIEIITTIVWVASGHHAAVNFGQYEYAGYIPNRPTIARENMPDEDESDEIWNTFIHSPEDALLFTFPNQMQALQVMVTLDVLSTHSPDEEYLGKDMEPAWGEDPIIKAAFEKFSGRLKELEGKIDERNEDSNLKNRNGAGVVPYNLLKPFWEQKVGDNKKEARGVPYSISI